MPGENLTHPDIPDIRKVNQSHELSKKGRIVFSCHMPFMVGNLNNCMFAGLGDNSRYNSSHRVSQSSFVAAQVGCTCGGDRE